MVLESNITLTISSTRKRDWGRLEVLVYWKPTRVNCYLHFNSHHFIHVRRGEVLIEPGASSLQRSHARKSKTLMKFSRMDTQHQLFFFTTDTQRQTESNCDAEEKPPLVSIPYSRVSEDISRAYHHFNIMQSCIRVGSIIITEVKDKWR